MFERYTERARRVLFFARFEASQFGSLTIEPEHLLLGLLREGKGLTSRLFGQLGVSLEDVHRAMTARLRVREKVATSVEMPIGPQLKRVLDLAAEEADRLMHTYIGTEHLLLGILREGRSAAAAVLNETGIRLERVLDEMQRLLSTAAAQPPPVLLQPDESQRADAAGVSMSLEVIAEGRRHWTLHHRDNGYWFVREGQLPEGPYCEYCWEDSRRWIRKRDDEQGRMACLLCGRG